MTRGRQPGGVVTTAKIWTDDGRRRAADLMGLTREEASDPKTLKRAFRKLCLRYHPDIARADDAADKFHELQEAYQVLATSEDASDFVELPDHLEWSAHDWRWAARYAGTSHVAGDGAFGGGDSARSSPITDPVMRPMEESERKAKLDAQLGAMAAAPVKRRRRVVKPLSTTPTPVPAAVQFTDDATTNEDANETKEDTKKEDDDNDDAAEAAEECPTDGCSSDDDLWNGESVDFQSMDENEKRAYAAFAARKTRGYQSDRHSTESAHSRLNGQLAGLHRKKVIRQRATGEIDLEDFKKDFKKNGGTGNKSAARRDGRDHEVRDETNAARFYGGGGCSWRRARLSGSCGSRSSPGSGASNGR